MAVVSLRSRWTLVVLALAALGLGYWGMWGFVHRSGSQYGSGVLDVAYDDLQLLVLGPDPLQNGGPLPWQLQIARFAIPAVPAYLLFLGARALLADQLQQLRIWRSSGHTILIGKPLAVDALARQLAAERPVVVIEAPGGPPAALTARVWRVVGDPQSDDTLRRAGVARAYELVLVSADTALNAEIAVRASRLAATRNEPLQCRVEMDDRALWLAASLRSPGPGSHIDLFNPNTVAARGMLTRSRWQPTRDGTTLVIGDGELGAALTAELIRRSSGLARAVDAPKPVTVRLPAQLPFAVTTRYPPTGALNDLEPVTADRWPDPAMFHIRGAHPGQVFICLDDEGAGMSLGLSALSALLTDSGIGGATMVAVTRNAGFGDALDERQLTTYNVTTEVYRMDQLRLATEHRVAQAIHAEYRAELRRQALAGHHRPADRTWDELPPDLRRANYEQAEDIGHKLAEIHCAVTPSTADAPPFAFAAWEVEKLARREHERWMAAKTRDGFVPGPDRTGSEHPDLVPWEELSAASRELDASAVRNIPALLADVGLQIVRLGRRKG